MAKTIFITGASSGIGKATAKYFTSKGWNVVATMRNVADGEDLENAFVCTLDVTKTETIKDAVSAAVEKFGSIDVLLNNAGYGNGGALEAISMEKLKRQYDVNVLGLLAVTKAVLPIMRKQKSGTIVNISSVGGKVALPFFAPYNGTKFAVEGITEALKFELEPLNIEVKLVEPGAINTDFSGRSLDFVFDENLSEYQEMTEKFNKAMSSLENQGAQPELVAKVIEEAINTEGLRFIAGEDAKGFIKMRKDLDDDAMYQETKKILGF